MRESPRRRAFLVAALAALGLLACWWAAYHDGFLARADTRAYLAFQELSLTHTRLASLARTLADICRPVPYVYLAAVPVIVCLLRRRLVLAVGVCLMMPAAVLSAELLKPALNAPRPAAGQPETVLNGVGTWPSGHATAVMILVFACLLASPPRWRPWVAGLGTLLGLGVIYAVLILGWHYPTDAVGGVLMASLWASACLALVGGDPGVPARAGETGSATRAMLVGPLLATVALIIAVLAIRGHDAVTFAIHHHAFFLAAIIIGLVTALAPATVALGLAGISGSGRAARAARPVRWRRG